MHSLVIVKRCRKTRGACNVIGLNRDSYTSDCQEWPFFKSMLDLIDVELGKASPLITEHYESKTVKDEELKRLGLTLREGLQQTILNILKVQLAYEKDSFGGLDT